MRAARLAFAAFALLAGAGCIGLFEPETPVPPSTGSSSVEVNYTTPSLLLQTLADAIAAKGQGNGPTAYRDAFAIFDRDGVDFVATFDPEVEAQYLSERGVPPPVWTRDLEEGFYAELATERPEGYLLSWSDPFGEDELQDNQVLIHRKYQLRVVDEEFNAQERIATGIAHLRMIRVGGNRWTITEWDDEVDPEVGATPEDPDELSFGKRRLQ